MKKSKLIFKVDRNNHGKLYFNGKWHKDVTMVDIHGEPWWYEIEVEKYIRGERGEFVVENNEVAKKTKVYQIGRKICRS